MGRSAESSGTTRRGRRRFLQLAAASGLSVPFGAMAAWPTGPRSRLDALLSQPPICHAADHPDAVAPGSSPREVRIVWNPNALCQLGVPIAEHLGLFAKRNLKVEFTVFSGAANELLEAMATGKADAGAGMAWQWLKPLEQGFDVKLAAALHGGCIRLLITSASGITTIADLKGKTVGTFNMASPDKIFISVLAAKHGVDLNEIDWRVYPPDLLGVALQKGEIQAFSSLDPMASILRDRDHLVEVSNNLADEFAHRACCMFGIRGSLVRDERPVAAAITAAIMEAQEFVATNPDGAAEIFAKTNRVASAQQFAAMLRTETHHHHPVDGALRQEVIAFAQDLKQAKVLQASTDPTALADQVCVDIFAA
jgi:NitT/TauT family transport system substrate-binding protein